ncbi:ABC transporter substrate-binding protein [Actinosynnema sp. NPDC023587]|uniref:ABC transporter substrate-binding protein n=1 Tax=Actinosynnema sp. NPDC023587 TaxID=3154695 RepID=UPI0033F992A1
MTRAPSRGLAAVAAAALLASCGSGPEPVDPTHLRIAYGWYPTCFDYAQSNPFAIFGRQVLDTLLSKNPDTGALEPYLAESWKTLDDGRTYEFTVRDGVTFSNGEALTARVVADNFEKLWELAGQGVSPTAGAYLRGYERAEAVDDRTVRVRFTQANAGFPQANTEGQFGIIAPASLARTPEERCAQGTVGSGPYVLDEAVQDERVEYVKRQGYDWAPAAFSHAGEAALDRVTIRIVPEENVRASGVLAGEHDVAYSMTETGLAQARGSDSVATVVAPGIGVVNSFLVNTAHPVLADPAVRRALQHGIDREEYAKTFYGEGVEAATDVVSRAHPYYRDRSALLAHDPALSRDLLDEAGWVPGDGGVRVKDGVRLELELTYSSGDIGTARSGWEYVQSRLAEIGIALRLSPVSDAEQLDRRNAGTWQLAVGQGASRGDADGIAAFYHTGLTTWKSQQARPEVDEPLDRQARTVDPEERRRIVDQAVTTILDQGYGIPLFDSSQVILVSGSVRDLTFPVSPWEPILYRAKKG